jgi:hypothetical protein
MGLLDNILGKGISETVGAVGNAIDKIVTSDDERLKAKNEITTIVTAYSQNLVNSASEVIKTEATGNWLQRSWRPIIMLTASF